MVKNLGLAKHLNEEAFSWNWMKYSQENPAIKRECHSESLSGWVMENKGRIVGFFGSIPRLYRYGNDDISVSVASTWVVEKEYRTHTGLLSKAFFNQENIDMQMVTSAIKPTSRIFERFSGKRMPLLDYENVLFWIINPSAFIKSFLLKLKFNSSIAGFYGYILSPFLSALMAFKIKSVWPQSGRENISIESQEIDKIGEDFNELWFRKIEEKKCIYAYRTAEHLRWSLEIVNKSNPINIFCCRCDKRLEGYIIIINEILPEICLNRVKVIDLFVINDNFNIIDSLFAATFKKAFELGCHVVEVIGLPEKIRRHLLKHRPFLRKYTNFPYYYRVNSEKYKTILGSPEPWYPTPFDGDSSFY